MAENATSTASVATDTATNATGASTGTAAEENANPTGTGEQTEQTVPFSAEAIDKLVQSRVDKITAELGKKNAGLQKELDKMKKEKLSDDELKQYEIKQRENAIAEREKELTDKANRITAITELTKAELYDGSETANTLLNMVVNGVTEETEIIESVKALKTVIDNLVAEGVDNTFAAKGRIPNGGEKSGEPENKKDTSIAETIGKKAAERTKNSNEILNLYYGGKK